MDAFFLDEVFILRLDKLLSDRGFGTRKDIKKLIQKHGAYINGTLTKDPGTHVTESDQVVFDGKDISCDKFQYFLFHKPAGCVCANEDGAHDTIFKYVPNPRNQFFSVGRLDLDTEGLLLITNDGALAHHLLSPRHHVNKTYFARLDHGITEDDIDAFSEGIDIGDEDLTLPAQLVRANEAGDEIYLTIQEGRFHQVKRMFLARDNEVLSLRRDSMGPFALDDSIPIGTYRAFTAEAIQMIMKNQE